MLGKLKNRKGFTLVELLLVIAVLGIILGISIPRIIANTSGIKLDADKKSAEMAGKKIETMIYLKNADVIFDNTDEHIVSAADYGEALPKCQSKSNSTSGDVLMKLYVQKGTDGFYTVTVTNGGTVSAENNLYQKTGIKPAEY